MIVGSLSSVLDKVILFTVALRVCAVADNLRTFSHLFKLQLVGGTSDHGEVDEDLLQNQEAKIDKLICMRLDRSVFHRDGAGQRQIADLLCAFVSWFTFQPR